MRNIIFISICIAISPGYSIAADSNNVKGHFRKDGTYIQGHTRSSPDKFRYNNKGSQTYGGNQRDEYSSGTGATNRTNSSYRWRDNDRDGVINAYDKKPDTKRAQ